MAPRRSPSLSLVCLALLAAAGLRALGFVAPSPRASAPSRVQRAAYESGKVNAGAEIGEGAAPLPPPVLECDEGCVTAIYDCIEDGCSVEALEKLDVRLAADESKIATSLEELSSQQKLNFSPENAGAQAWLQNFLSRSGSLRAQLQSLKSVVHAEGDLVSQIMKAAAVAFGGGRKGDYPKVGVSGYSA